MTRHLSTASSLIAATNVSILSPSTPTPPTTSHEHNGGGIALYVHLSLSCDILLKGGPFELELISLSVLSHLSLCKFGVCLFYRPPSSPVSIFDKLCTTLQILNPAVFSNFLLLGDFNVDFCNPNSNLYSHVNDLLLSFSLTQIVPSPTHISPSGNPSLIDLAMVANTEYLKQCTPIPPLSTSDHLGLSITLQWKVLRAPPRKSRKYGSISMVILKRLVD